MILSGFRKIYYKREFNVQFGFQNAVNKVLNISYYIITKLQRMWSEILELVSEFNQLVYTRKFHLIMWIVIGRKYLTVNTITAEGYLKSEM